MVNGGLVLLGDLGISVNAAAHLNSIPVKLDRPRPSRISPIKPGTSTEIRDAC